jgi:hypothetical protein
MRRESARFRKQVVIDTDLSSSDLRASETPATGTVRAGVLVVICHHQ